ncbi:helix-turn-helix transcriptional regulator [Streptomyces sp. E11-3]|uniref:helix-turn-helix domain-containing protein n=1 Tax=Streptomyces sp. E11-3 TaxID=3110112 RepID=UPI00397EC423
MTWDWKRLGRELRAARKAKGLKQTDLVQVTRVSLATVQNIEAGKEYTRITPTIRAVARAVGWTDSSPEAVLNGEQPTLVDADERGQSPPPQSDLPLPPFIQEELREGQVLASGVYDLSPEDSDAQMIIVVKGKKGASVDEIRQWRDRWRRAERDLRRLSDEETQTRSPDDA